MPDWDAIATLATGLAAVGAAYWTVKRTEKAARREAADRKGAVAVRTFAFLEVAKEGLEILERIDRSSVIPWNAFSALSADIGLLGINLTKRFFLIEDCARKTEFYLRKGDESAADIHLRALKESIEALKIHMLKSNDIQVDTLLNK